MRMITPDTDARRLLVRGHQDGLRLPRRSGTGRSRLPLVAVLLVSLACAVAARSAVGAPNESFHATFVESRVSTTDRLADLGTLQFVNTGTGSVDGFGAATVVLAMSQDRTVEPCGAGSSTNAGIRRVVVADGVLVLRTLAYVCQTATGPAADGTWTVDGDSSTGVFAGARGSGSESVDIATRTATLSGKLKLASGGA
jgi:hypothetical protein